MLTVGGHDHLAGAVGAGAAETGDVLDSCGTAEAFVQATAPLRPEAVGSAVRSGLSVGWHAVEGRQAVIGGVMSGSALERVLALLGVDPADRDALEAAALEIERRHRGPTLSVAGLGEDALALIGRVTPRRRRRTTPSSMPPAPPARPSSRAWRPWRARRDDCW